MLTSIEGKSVLVTGASKGIGKGIARVFAKAGGKILVVSRNGEEAEAAERQPRSEATLTTCSRSRRCRGHRSDIEPVSLGMFAQRSRVQGRSPWRGERGRSPQGVPPLSLR